MAARDSKWYLITRIVEPFIEISEIHFDVNYIV